MKTNKTMKIINKNIRFMKFNKGWSSTLIFEYWKPSSGEVNSVLHLLQDLSSACIPGGLLPPRTTRWDFQSPIPNPLVPLTSQQPCEVCPLISGLCRSIHISTYNPGGLQLSENISMAGLPGVLLLLGLPEANRTNRSSSTPGSLLLPWAIVLPRGLLPLGLPVLPAVLGDYCHQRLPVLQKPGTSWWLKATIRTQSAKIWVICHLQ